MTDGNAVDLTAIGERVPAWASAIQIRYLARGARIVLDMSEPGNARNLPALDPLDTTQALNGLVDLSTLHDQFEHNNDASIPPRLLRTQRFHVKVQGDDSLYLNLDATGRFAVTAEPQPLLIDEAWTLSSTRPALPFPASFDDVVLRTDVGHPGHQFTLTRIRGRAGRALCWQPLGGVPYYVSTVGPGYTTTDVNERGLALFEAAPVGRDAPPDGAQRTVSLRAFCDAVGVPTDPPPSCAALLPQLVGPQDGATLAAEITLPAIARALGWQADLDASTVTYAEDERGPLISAADVAIRLGAQRTVTIDERTVAIEQAAATLARELPDALALTGSLTATDEVGVSQTAAVEHPTRTRTLDQYLFDVGMDPAQRPQVTTGTLLSALVGAQPIAEQLLLRAPSLLTAPQLLELLGLPVPDVLVPDGAPAFDELPFTAATATLSVDPFQLETLTVVVATERTLPLLAEPAIELTSLTEQLDYERTAQPPTRGVVTGRLALERASVTLPYVRGADGVPEFRAAVTLAPADAPDFRTLISAAPWEPGYRVPAELDIPAAIPLTTLTAAAWPGAFVDVEGFDADTTWTFAIDRLTLRLAQLGGRVRVAASPPGYAVALHGTLRYDGFVGAGVRPRAARADGHRHGGPGRDRPAGGRERARPAVGGPRPGRASPIRQRASRRSSPGPRSTTRRRRRAPSRSR